MKTRIHLAGGKHGVSEGAIWKGDLPMVSGVPGMRIVLVDDAADSVSVYSFKQVCLEVHKGDPDHVEQVLYANTVKTDDGHEVLLG